MLQKVGHAEFGRVPSAVRVPPAAVWQPQIRTMVSASRQRAAPAGAHLRMAARRVASARAGAGSSASPGSLSRNSSAAAKRRAEPTLAHSIAQKLCCNSRSSSSARLASTESAASSRASRTASARALSSPSGCGRGLGRAKSSDVAGATRLSALPEVAAVSVVSREAGAFAVSPSAGCPLPSGRFEGTPSSAWPTDWAANSTS